VIPLLDDCNSMGARDLRVLPWGVWGTPVASRLLGPDSQIRAAFLLGANVMSGTPDPAVARRLQQLDLLVVHELFMTDTARLADVILPAASFAEKLGTFTNTERRVQMIHQTVPSPGVARADWEILVDLSQYLPTPLDYGLPSDVWEDIRRNVPEYEGLSHADLGAQGARPAALQRA
jgi:predicted molibdopterin-dependent oxidoreductase YjgC